MPQTSFSESSCDRLIQPSVVVSNTKLCTEHYRLTLRVANLPPAHAGQFVHLNPVPVSDDYRLVDWQPGGLDDDWPARCALPMLRRAFSIAGLRRGDNGVDVDVIYRVVGAATHWMESLRPGESASVLGPLGNHFPVSNTKSQAWLIAGGVGLPPMLWLAETLQGAKKKTSAFYGAQRAELLAVTIDDKILPDRKGEHALLCTGEFGQWSAGTVVSTDDGSVGFRGHIGAALATFSQANPPDPADLVMYTCGPERMMEFVARFCVSRGIECYVCMERAMACGTGTCQSCVVEVTDAQAPDGWRYRLCCTEGPVFPAEDIIWDR